MYYISCIFSRQENLPLPHMSREGQFNTGNEHNAQTHCLEYLSFKTQFPMGGSHKLDFECLENTTYFRAN